MGFLSDLKNIIKADFNQPQQQIQQQQQRTVSDRPDGFALYVGCSSGELGNRGHAAGLVRGQDVWLAKDDCCQNICVMGKTYSAPSLQ